jgi:NADPH-dependent glutamate synthase beta subunit-like oxidoreductase
VWRVAIVGAGPSGLYAADALTAQTEIAVEVTVIDRLPVPFGLVRYGVAPDHLSIRSVRGTLTKVLERQDVAFLGDVEVGKDVTVDELAEQFDAVIYSFGAARDRHLGVPGEDLPGSIAATDLVNWYCGHPDAPVAEIEAEVSTARQVVVVGVGNVAVDVTRVLAKNNSELNHTDIPQHVLDVLAATHIEDIYLLGRRGPVQAAFTTKELRELGELEDVDVVVSPADVELDPVSEAALAGDRVATRNVEVVKEWAGRTPSGKPRRLHVRFLTRPVRLVGEGHVAAVEVERTRIDETGGAVGTGEFETIQAQVVVRSVGYRGVGLPGLPFDERRNVIPSVDGRIVAGVDSSEVLARGYVTGWIRRGPSGIIGTNKKDAAATVASVLADSATMPSAPGDGRAGLEVLLAERGVTPITFAGWENIDAAEIALGAERGRDRTTLHTREALRTAAS